jgi:hypothetical protein
MHLEERLRGRHFYSSATFQHDHETAKAISDLVLGTKFRALESAQGLSGEMSQQGSQREGGSGGENPI